MDTLGLFSPNEQADDVATADLKYLLVPYLLAEAQSRDSTQDKALHLQRLEEAASSLRTSVCPSGMSWWTVHAAMSYLATRCSALCDMGWDGHRLMHAVRLCAFHGCGTGICRPCCCWVRCKGPNRHGNELKPFALPTGLYSLALCRAHL